MMRGGLVAVLLLCLAWSTAYAQQSRPARDAGGLKVGDMAPAFRLRSLDGEAETDLETFRCQKPVVLIFGSYT